MKVSVQLAMMIRQVKTVIVEVPEGCEATDREIADVVWEADDGTDFEDDVGAGIEEGRHSVYFLDDDEQHKAADYVLAQGESGLLVATPLKP